MCYLFDTVILSARKQRELQSRRDDELIQIQLHLKQIRQVLGNLQVPFTDM